MQTKKIIEKLDSEQVPNKQIQNQMKLSYQETMKAKLLPIGSIKTQRINYDMDEQFFSPEYIPKTARQAKIQTKDFLDSDIMERKKRLWNTSVEAPRRFDQYQESHQDKLFKIRSGFYDEKKIINRPNRIFEGTEARDDYTKWNVSVEVSKGQLKKKLFDSTLDSLSNSINFTNRLKNYQNPFQKYEDSVEKQKERYAKEGSLRETLRSSYLFENPLDTEHKTSSKVRKMVDEQRRSQLRKQLFGDPVGKEISSKIKANLSSLQKSKIITNYFHTGIWQNIKVAKDTDQCWSCCLNEEKQSRGCTKIIKDGNKANLASFNNN